MGASTWTTPLCRILSLVAAGLLILSPTLLAQTNEAQDASFPLPERLHLGFGAGVQIAVSQFHRYNHRWIASVRLPF